MSDKIDMLFIEVQEIRKDIQTLLTDVAGLKVRMGLISGGVSAVVSIIVGVLIAILA